MIFLMIILFVVHDWHHSYMIEIEGADSPPWSHPIPKNRILHDNPKR